MGTKILHESYSLRSYPTREVIMNLSCNWPFFCEGSRLSGMSNDCSSWTPQHRYDDEYNMKLLRETILRHEEIFRKQVCELHRLYKVQRICMDELKGVSVQTDPKVRKSPRKVFDLHLPADAYIDDEDAEDESETGPCRKTQKDLPCYILADLNEPVEECDEEDGNGRSPPFPPWKQSSCCSITEAQALPCRSSGSSSQQKSTLVNGFGSGLQRCSKIPRDMDLNVEPSEKEELQMPDLFWKMRESSSVQEQSEMIANSPRSPWRVGQSVESREVSSQPDLPKLNGRKILGFAVPQADHDRNRGRDSHLSDPSSPCKSLGFEKRLKQADPSSPCTAASDCVALNPGKNLRSHQGNVRFGSEIDLEAPAAEAEDKGEVHQETEIRDLTILVVAAETIQSLSNHARTSRDEGSPWPSPSSSSSHALHWFAQAVTGSGGDQTSSSDVDGMDSFERAALKLESVEAESCVGRSGTEVNDNPPAAEENRAADLLLKRSRRGRRWQRREFQRDILPGLATLSRQEVAEDLQILAAMVRVTGQPWKKIGGQRRNAAGRGRQNCRARGGRRSAAVRPAAILLDAPARISAAAEQSLGEERSKSILGWGRTTRRCWRQRCSSGSPAAELVVAMDG